MFCGAVNRLSDDPTTVSVAVGVHVNARRKRPFPVPVRRCRLRKASASKTSENLGVLPAAYLFPRCSTDSRILSRTLTSDYPRNHVRLERGKSAQRHPTFAPAFPFLRAARRVPCPGLRCGCSTPVFGTDASSSSSSVVADERVWHTFARHTDVVPCGEPRL